MARKSSSRRPAPPSIPSSEFTARRRALRSGLKGFIGVLFAGDAVDHLHDTYRPHPHFEYFTGVTNEPSAVLVIDPSNPVAARREILFLRPLNPELEQWDGLRQGLGKALREELGIGTVLRTTHLPRMLSDAARRSRSLACLHPLAQYDQPLSPDLALFNKLADRIPGVTISDQTELIARLRSVKSAAEVKMISRAIEITRLGYLTALESIRPGLSEFDVQEALEHGYRANGSRGPAYGTIAGAGLNATVLHYRANDQPLLDGDVICIDSGASYGGYGADITRTVPAGGTFTKRQRDIYQIVLKAQEAAISAVKPGATLSQVDASARAVITKAGYGDAFIHGTGHHLGLETHDITPSGPLQAGNVITIEPGIYLPDEKIGVRIEDDILVTKDGRRNLSSSIPKRAVEIEKLMAGG